SPSMRWHDKSEQHGSRAGGVTPSCDPLARNPWPYALEAGHAHSPGGLGRGRRFAITGMRGWACPFRPTPPQAGLDVFVAQWCDVARLGLGIGPGVHYRALSTGTAQVRVLACMALLPVPPEPVDVAVV